MNKKVFDELLKRGLQGEGFPVFATFVDIDTNSVLSYVWNKKSVSTPKNERHHNHSEYMLVLKSDVEGIADKSLSLIITLPPCSECIKKLEKLKNLKVITYLFDPWRKSQKSNGHLNLFSQNSNVTIIRNEISHEFIEDNWKKYWERMHTKKHKDSLRRLKKHQKSNNLLKY